MNKSILKTDVQVFINKNISSSIQSLILKGSLFKEVNIKELVEQIEAKKKYDYANSIKGEKIIFILIMFMINIFYYRC